MAFDPNSLTAPEMQRMYNFLEHQILSFISVSKLSEIEIIEPWDFQIPTELPLFLLEKATKIFIGICIKIND